MSPASLGIETAIVLLLVASVAAIQARAVRGAQRHRILERCRASGHPERYDEIVAGSETIAFVAASVVVIAAAVATLLVGRPLLADPAKSRVLGVSEVAGWIAVVWLMLVVVPMLVTKIAGPWIVVATWRLWRPIVRLEIGRAHV